MTKKFDNLIELLRTDDSKIAYGEEYISSAATQGAIGDIFIDDSVPPAVHALLKSIKAQGGKIHRVTSKMSCASQLHQLGGAAAILRHPIADMEFMHIDCDCDFKQIDCQWSSSSSVSSDDSSSDESVATTASMPEQPAMPEPFDAASNPLSDDVEAEIECIAAMFEPDNHFRRLSRFAFAVAVGHSMPRWFKITLPPRLAPTVKPFDGALLPDLPSTTSVVELVMALQAE